MLHKLAMIRVRLTSTKHQSLTKKLPSKIVKAGPSATMLKVPTTRRLRPGRTAYMSLHYQMRF
eukprot:7441003-Karenia_brevis.AAC.1